MTRIIVRPILLGLAAGVLLTGCGTTSDDSAAGGSTPTAAVSTAPARAKVSANTASRSEISAALQTAGVSNSDRWAKEIVEYRPYDASDASLARLRQKLAKYKPGEDVLNKIVSALQP